MARPYKELRDKMSTEARERVDARIRETLVEMNLAELRTRVQALTQAELSEILETTQGAISQLERREDALLSTLRDYVQALGGKLEVVAHFPDTDPIRITQFDGVKKQIAEAAG